MLIGYESDEASLLICELLSTWALSYMLTVAAKTLVDATSNRASATMSAPSFVLHRPAWEREYDTFIIITLPHGIYHRRQ